MGIRDLFKGGLKRSAHPVCEHGVRDGKQEINGVCKCKACQAKKAKAVPMLEPRPDPMDNRTRLQVQFANDVVDAIVGKRGFQDMPKGAIGVLVYELLDRLGYQFVYDPTVRPGSGNMYDGDLREKDGTRTLVYCKMYKRTTRVSCPMLQKLRQEMETRKAYKGLFITTGDFGSDALLYAQQNNIQTVNGTELKSLLWTNLQKPERRTEYTLHCRECGEPVTFRYADTIIGKPCANGHPVPHIFARATSEYICLLCGSPMRIDGKHCVCTNSECGWRVPEFDLKDVLGRNIDYYQNLTSNAFKRGLFITLLPPKSVEDLVPGTQGRDKSMYW